MNISEKKGIALMLTSVLFFAIHILAAKGLALHSSQCSIWQITLYRGISGICVVLLFFSGKGLRWKSLWTRPRLIIRGILGGTALAFFYLTIIELGAARAMVINVTYPIFAAIMAAAFLGESLGLRKLLWIFMGFIGLVIFMGPEALTHGISPYDLIAIALAVLSAAVVVIIRSLHNTEHSSTIFASQAVFGSLFVLPMALSEPVLPDFSLITLMFLVGIASAIAQLTMTFAYRLLEVAKGSSLQMLLPIITAAGSWFLFQEHFVLIEICGGILTLLSTAMVARETSKKTALVASPQPTNS